MTERIKLTKGELIHLFEEQLFLLKEHCNSYKNNKSAFAKEMATKLRTMLCAKSGKPALIKQLKLDHIPFVRSNPQKYDPANLNPHHPLLSINFGWDSAGDRAIEFVPYGIKENGSLVTYEYWWDAEKIIVETTKINFTRKDVVVAVADCHGGAHVDTSLPVKYYRLSKLNSLLWMRKENRLILPFGSKTDKEAQPLNDPIPSLIFQIATEVLKSFENKNLEQESKL